MAKSVTICGQCIRIQYLKGIGTHSVYASVFIFLQILTTETQDLVFKTSSSNQNTMWQLWHSKLASCSYSSISDNPSSLYFFLFYSHLKSFHKRRLLAGPFPYSKQTRLLAQGPPYGFCIPRTLRFSNSRPGNG